MKILICGSKSFTDKEYLFATCLDIISRNQYLLEISTADMEIVSGKNPKGADFYGEQFAKKHKIRVKEFPAKWDDLTAVPTIIGTTKNGKQYNKLAGFNRNQEMIDYISDDPNSICIAFRVEGSPGTTDTIKRAKKAGIRTYQIDYDKGKKIKVWNG